MGPLGRRQRLFGLILDNVAVMIVLVTLVTAADPAAEHGFSREFVLTQMIPGTVLGVVLGDFVLIPLDEVLSGGAAPTHMAAFVQSLRCLANGFVVTSLLSALALAAMLDRRLLRAAGCCERPAAWASRRCAASSALFTRRSNRRQSPGPCTSTPSCRRTQPFAANRRTTGRRRTCWPAEC
jgi:hypothetical protein